MSDSPGAVARPTSRSPLAAADGATGDVEQKFDELAGAVFQHCRNQLGTDDDDESIYPIAEQQQKRKLEQQISIRYPSMCVGV